jgi:hypothetical protein
MLQMRTQLGTTDANGNILGPDDTITYVADTPVENADGTTT